MLRATLLGLLLPAVGLAVSPTNGPTLVTSQTTVNNGPGNQLDPRVSGDFAAYSNSVSGSQTIHYFNFATSADSEISNQLPGGGQAVDSLSDVGGTIVVFTRAVPGKNAVMIFNVATSGPAAELDPQAGSRRRRPAIGGGTVAWEDRGFTLLPEVVVHELATGVTTRLTSDSVTDREVAVSPNGNVIAWERCPSLSACDIFKATRSGASWSVSAVTATAEPENFPDTNGSIVVYGASRAASATGSDIFWTTLATGAESQLAIAGLQRNPNISGNLVAFESVGSGSTLADVYVYDLATNTLFQLTNTPALDEVLNDISIDASGLVRVVWSVFEADFNVYALSFTLPGQCEEEEDEGDCEDPGSRPLLASLQVNRTTGAPNTEGARFAGTGEGLLCVDNGHGGARATSGWVNLNGELEAEPDDFKKSVALIEEEVELSGNNVLAARIAGAPGSAFRVRVYGEAPECEASDADELVARLGPSVRPVKGERFTVSDDGVHRLEIDPRAEKEVALGCSSVGGEWLIAALLVAAALTVLHRRWAYGYLRRRR
ncbi:MAG: hypothetical protein HYZ28_18500 [Myxococcales bacterium]|nr:hypothetical protein [Myxococcales bacterium]